MHPFGGLPSHMQALYGRGRPQFTPLEGSIYVNMVKAT